MPRKNGELVFQTPWESRVFGIAVTLCEQDVFEWEEFRQSLITEIREWENVNHLIPKPIGTTISYGRRPLRKYYFERGYSRVRR